MLKKLSSGLGLALASSASFAAVDATVTTAMSDTQADVTTIGAAAFLIVLVVASYRYMRRAV